LKENTKSLQFVLVRWSEDTSGVFNVVPVGDVLCGGGESLEMEKEYWVKWNGKRFKASMLVIGSEEHCNKLLANMCEYEVQKAQKNKQTISCAPDTSKEDEILLLRRQLVERDGLIETKTQIIEQHFQTIQELKSELVELNETIDLADKNKLIQIGRLILSSFATTEDLVDLRLRTGPEGAEARVTLSPVYPSVRVPYHTKREADVQARNDSISGSRLFRLLICSLFTEDSFWASSGMNADKLLKDHHEPVSAVFDYVSLKRTDFNMRTVRKTLRELCSEARKRLKLTVKTSTKQSAKTAATSQQAHSPRQLPSSDSASSLASTIVLPTNSQNSNSSSIETTSPSSSSSSSTSEPYTSALSKTKRISNKLASK